MTKKSKKLDRIQELKLMARVFQLEAEDMEKELEALENQAPEDDGCTIREGDLYDYVNEYGDVDSNEYNGLEDNKFCIDSNNSYKTEQGAENHKLRLLSMKPKYSIDEFMKAKRVYIIYTLSYTGKFYARESCFVPSYDYLSLYNLGRAFLTEEEAQEWIDTYGPAWLAKDERWLRYE